MDWHDFLAAIALVLVFEGIMPFLSPPTLKRTMATIISLDDRTLRAGGLVAMVVGAMLLFFIR